MSRNPVLFALSPLVVLVASCGFSPGGETAANATPSPPKAAHGEDAVPDAQKSGYRITDHARFDQPWAMAFVPGTSYVLVTEKTGTLKLWQDKAEPLPVAGTPAVDHGGQGGLGDIAVSPSFAQDSTVYLSWAEAGPNDTRGAVVGKARLVMGPAPRLEGLSIIWRQTPKVTGRGHYSHRIAFSPDGAFLFIASGDRQKKTPAQDMAGNLGKIVRLTLDGAPASGNPFAAQGGVAAQIWSLGHRNVLGLQFDKDGRLWDLEHGPAGGDELNLVVPGANYGWPIVSNGDNYDGSVIPRHSTRPEFVPPVIGWTPVIAPGNFVFYHGSLFEAWQGHAIIAGMAYPGLVRVAIDNGRAREEGRIALGKRIRDVRVAPDGAIWVLEDGPDGRLRRIVPNAAAPY